MIRPYEMYIRFLVTKGHSELDEFTRDLSELALPSIDQEELDSVFAKIHETLPTSVSNQVGKKKYSPDFWKWMKVLDVYDLWSLESPLRNSENAFLRLAYDVNYDPAIRTCLRALLIKRVPHNDICQSLNVKFSSMIRPEHVSLYEKYFWNPSRMTRSAWKRYLPQAPYQEQNVLFLCLTEDIETVKAHLKLPCKLDLVNTYSQIFVQCNQKIDHYMRLSTIDSNREARQWIDTAMQLGDKIKKYEAGNIEDFGKALQMEFEFIDSEFPTPDETTMKELVAAVDKLDTSTKN